MSVTIKSNTSSDVLTVGANKAAYVEPRDVAGNSLIKTQRENLPSSQGALLVAGKNDNYGTILRTDRKGSLLTGNYLPELIEVFEGNTINAQKWAVSTTTFTTAQSTLAGFNFNSGNSTTAGAAAHIRSARFFQKIPRVPYQYKARLRQSLPVGAFVDLGFGLPAGTTIVNPNGACFRFVNSGAIQGVITINGVEVAIDTLKAKVNSNGNTEGADLTMANAYYTSNYFVYDLIIDDDNAVFTVQDTQTGEMIGQLSLPVPVNAFKMWGATALPVFARLVNNTAPATAPVFIVSELQVLSLDWDLNPGVSDIAGSLGLTAGRQPFTGAAIENHTNSTAPVNATLSNTAAGYTTMGGKFAFAAVAGAVTDYALFAYQVPTGARFLCQGVVINAFNTGAVVATTVTALEWAAGFGSTAVSLATANIIRRQLGYQFFAVGAGIGAPAERLEVLFQTPEVVESDRFLHVILNCPIGTATASQVIRGQVTVLGRFI